MDAQMGVDERVLRRHLDLGPFQSGVDRGRWRLIGIEWPKVLIAVHAVARDNSPAEYAFRFDCTNYPNAAPTTQPWDLDHNAPLSADRWPAGRDRVPRAFNPSWNGAQAVYLPCDRLAIAGHDMWITQHPALIWSPDKNITHYLRLLHDLLNSADYTGARSA